MAHRHTPDQVIAKVRQGQKMLNDGRPMVDHTAKSPSHFGSWKTVWKHHRRNSASGIWDSVLAALLTRADAQGLSNWEVSVDSTVNRAHQHGTNLPRHTGGPLELQESA